jgi:hypothetical protein
MLLSSIIIILLFNLKMMPSGSDINVRWIRSEESKFCCLLKYVSGSLVLYKPTRAYRLDFEQKLLVHKIWSNSMS